MMPIVGEGGWNHRGQVWRGTREHRKVGIGINAEEPASVPMLLRAGRGVGTIVPVDTFPPSPVSLTAAELQPKLGLLV